MITGARKRGESRWFHLLLLPLFLTASCSDETLSLFFDVPPPTAEEKAAEAAAEQAKAEARARQAVQAGQAAVEEEGEPPEIEAVFDWEQASEMLPKDEIDEVDWMAALRDGVIRPRKTVPGVDVPRVDIFKWDFYFAGPDPETDAYFPHSSHTEWLTCESCHPAIFPYRELGMDPSGRYGIVMDQIFEGEYCGKCHGTVAFSLDSCNRCHTNM